MMGKPKKEQNPLNEGYQPKKDSYLQHGYQPPKPQSSPNGSPQRPPVPNYKPKKNS